MTEIHKNQKCGPHQHQKDNLKQDSFLKKRKIKKLMSLLKELKSCCNKKIP